MIDFYLNNSLIISILRFFNMKLISYMFHFFQLQVIQRNYQPVDDVTVCFHFLHIVLVPLLIFILQDYNFVGLDG